MDPTDVFERMFEPYGDGYLYYSGKGGGRFITTAEYEELLARHRRRLGGRMSRTTITAFALLIALLVVAKRFDLSEDAQTIGMWVVVLIVIAYVMWAVSAPYRLVKDRPAITAPRPAAERRRLARSMLDWRLGLAGALVCAAILGFNLTHPENTVAWWAWTFLSAFMVITCLIVAVQWLRDRQT